MTDIESKVRLALLAGDDDVADVVDRSPATAHPVSIKRTLRTHRLMRPVLMRRRGCRNSGHRDDSFACYLW